MYYIVYHQWDSSGSGPAEVCEFDTMAGLEAKLDLLEEEKIKSNMKYDIILIVSGKRLIPKIVSRWDFDEASNKEPDQTT
jgi:hypothetical protein